MTTAATYEPGLAGGKSEPTGPTVVVDLPARFYEDHVGRDLEGGWVVKYLARKTRVQLDREAFDELLSDARHYAFDMDDMYLDDFAFAAALIGSARATVRALEAAARP